MPQDFAAAMHLGFASCGLCRTHAGSALHRVPHSLLGGSQSASTQRGSAGAPPPCGLGAAAPGLHSPEPAVYTSASQRWVHELDASGGAAVAIWRCFHIYAELDI